MGERIWFATSNWKDKPNKPSCYSQTQWDARNSSKFNGAPFAGAFAFDPAKTTLKGYSQSDFNAYKNAIQAISVPSCPGIGRQLGDSISNLPELKETDIPVKCEDSEMKVWNGSTYYDRTGANKTWNWNTCESGQSRSASAGVLDFKAPSASTEVYIPVCGPGTHIQEITKDYLMDIIWRVAHFDLNASGFSAENNIESNFSGPGYCSGGSSGTVNYSIKSKSSASTSNKNLNPTISSTGKESEIVSSKWTPCEKIGYDGHDAMSVSVIGYYYVDGPSGTGNGNVTVSASVSPADYECGYLSSGASGAINVTIKPFADRYNYIYFVTDSASGAEKIYFDPTGLFNFYMGTNGQNYYLDPANVAAPFSATVSILGKSFNLKINGPQNGTSSTNWYGAANGTMTRNFTPGSITITGKKYYTYANSKGEDVYDQNTGAQLKDPLS